MNEAIPKREKVELKEVCGRYQVDGKGVRCPVLGGLVDHQDIRQPTHFTEQKAVCGRPGCPRGFTR